MIYNFPPSFKLLMQTEMGFVNSSPLNGGPTNLGVTIPAWERWVKRPVNVAEIKSLTFGNVEPFYKVEFWDQVRGDLLPAGVDYCVFDCGVNSGPERGVILLQHALGVPQDGAFGPVTLAAAKNASPPELIKEYCFLRLAYMQGLENWGENAEGWDARVKAVQASALSMLEQPKAASDNPNGQ